MDILARNKGGQLLGRKEEKWKRDDNETELEVVVVLKNYPKYIHYKNFWVTTITLEDITNQSSIVTPLKYYLKACLEYL